MNYHRICNRINMHVDHICPCSRLLIVHSSDLFIHIHINTGSVSAFDIIVLKKLDRSFNFGNISRRSLLPSGVAKNFRVFSFTSTEKLKKNSWFYLYYVSSAQLGGQKEANVPPPPPWSSLPIFMHELKTKKRSSIKISDQKFLHVSIPII